MVLLFIFSFISSFSLFCVNGSQTITTTYTNPSVPILRLQLTTHNITQEQVISSLEENNLEEFKRLYNLLIKNKSFNFYALALKCRNWQAISFLLSEKAIITHEVMRELLLEAMNNPFLLNELAKYRNSDRQTILHQAVLLLDNELIKQILFLLPQLIDLQDNRGNTALHLILTSKSLENEELKNTLKNTLIEFNANTNIKNTNNRTAEQLLINISNNKNSDKKIENNNLSLKLKPPISKTAKKNKKHNTKLKAKNTNINPPPSFNENIEDIQVNPTDIVPHTQDNQYVNFEASLSFDLEGIEDPFANDTLYHISI